MALFDQLDEEREIQEQEGDIKPLEISEIYEVIRLSGIPEDIRALIINDSLTDPKFSFVLEEKYLIKELEGIIHQIKKPKFYNGVSFNVPSQYFENRGSKDKTLMVSMWVERFKKLETILNNIEHSIFTYQKSFTKNCLTTVAKNESRLLREIFFKEKITSTDEQNTLMIFMLTGKFPQSLVQEHILAKFTEVALQKVKPYGEYSFNEFTYLFDERNFNQESLIRLVLNSEMPSLI